MAQTKAEKLLLVGWDSADWQVINPLIERGAMPNLSGLMNRGVMGNLASMEPMVSPMLWNSIATGKRADKHGILGFVEPDPDQRSIRPFTSTSRRCKAIWNIFTQCGLESQVVAWYAGHPAEPIRGACISEMYQKAVGPVGEPWPIKPGTIHPQELEEPLSTLRIHPAEIQGDMILPFVPRAAEVDQSRDRHLSTLARIMSESINVHSAATWLLEHRPWDFAAVYFDGIDHLSHAFMPFHPPRLDEINEKDFDLYHGVVEGTYRFHDMMLGRLIGLAGPNAHIMVVSDHGFFSNHLRPRGIPDEPSGPTVCHRPFGIFCLAGPGIKADERVYGAGILDIAPTILTLFGLPIGRDMDGKVIGDAFETPPGVERIDSWESEPGEAGMHPPERRRDPLEAQEAVDQLMELGYLTPPDDDKAQWVRTAQQEIELNLAITCLAADEVHRAFELLEKLSRQLPKRPRIRLLLAQCLMKMQRFDEARAVIEALIQNHEDTAPAHALMGTLLLAQRRPVEALEHLQIAEQGNARLPALHCVIGGAYARLRQWGKAKRAFQKALEIDGDSAVAWEGLARCYLAMLQPSKAADASLRAVGLLHCFPAAHFDLGLALVRLGRMERAVTAFETCLYFQPQHIRAAKWLGRIYLHVYKDQAKADEYFARAEKSHALRLRREQARATGSHRD